MSQSANQPLSIFKTTIIDKDGDITMVMGDAWTSNGPRFRVSSSLLSLASASFRTLLKAYTQRNDNDQEPVDVSVHESDTASMEILLSVLHYHNTEKYESLTPERLAGVARLSDRYECNKAMRPFATQWLRSFGSDIELKHYGPLLLATWYFDREDLPKVISVGAIKRLPFTLRTQWTTEGISPDLPKKVKDAVFLKINEAHKRLRIQVEAVEPALREDRSAWDTPRMTCPYCARVLHENANYCRACRSNEVYPWLCFKQSRITDYFYFLGRAELWPATERFGKLSISELVERVGKAKDFVYNLHDCDAEGECPLWKAVLELNAKANQILKDIQGVEIPKLRGQGQ